MALFDLRAPLPRKLRPYLAIAAPALVIGVWCLLSYGEIISSTFLPSPTEVIRGLLQLFFEKDLGTAILTSTKRITIAFLLAAGTALPLGILMGAFEPINRFFEP